MVSDINEPFKLGWVEGNIRHSSCHIEFSHRHVDDTARRYANLHGFWFRTILI